MKDMKTHVKHSIMDLSRQVIEKNYLQESLGCRLQRFKDTRRETRNKAILERRNIDADNISPFESVRKKKNVPEIPAARPAVSNRLEKLKQWREEKNKRKLEEKKTAKPIFKVYHVHNSIGLPNYETINKEIKGKLIKSLIKPSQPEPSLVPKSKQFKAPKMVKPLYLNNVKRNRENQTENSSNKNVKSTTAVKKNEITKSETVVMAKISKKPTTKMTSGQKSLESCSPPVRRMTRLMSMKLAESTKKFDNAEDTNNQMSAETKSRHTETKKKSPRTPRSKSLPVPTTPHTPEPPLKLEVIGYVSPFVTLSRGKDSIRKEYKHRMSTGGSVPGNSATSPLAAASYFSNMLRDEIVRIEKMCEEWNSYKEGDVPDEAKEMIDVALGQSKLLMSKKFQQFKKLIERCGNDDGAKQPVTCMDLHGFWDMMYMQVEDIDKRFNNLSELRSNEWKEVLQEQKVKSKKTKRKAAKPKAPSKIKHMIEQAKAKNLLKQQSPVREIHSPHWNSSGLPGMSLSRSINVGLTPNKSILKTEETKDKRVNKNVLFNLSTVKSKLNFNVEDKENTEDPEMKRTPLRRSRRLSQYAD